MRRTYGALALVLALAGCGHPTTAQPEHQVTTKPARVPADPNGFVGWIGNLGVSKAKPFDRANEICDWFDQGYSFEQVHQAESAVLQRDWPETLDKHAIPAIDATNYYEVGFLISGSAKFVCPEHANKRPSGT